MSEFNLDALIRDVLGANDSPDTYVLAKEVARLIPEDEVMGVIEQLLPARVATHVHAERKVYSAKREVERHLPRFEPAVQSRGATHGTRDGEGGEEASGAASTHTSDAPRPRSNRVSGAAAVSANPWRVFGRYSIPLSEGEYDRKWFEDLTSGDCLAIAKMHESLANAHEKQDRRFRLLARSISSQGAERIADLDVEYVTTLMEQTA